MIYDRIRSFAYDIPPPSFCRADGAREAGMTGNGVKHGISLHAGKPRTN